MPTKRNRWGLTEAQVFFVARAGATEQWRFRASHRRSDANPRMARALVTQGLARRLPAEEGSRVPWYEFTARGREVALELLPHIPI